MRKHSCAQNNFTVCVKCHCRLKRAMRIKLGGGSSCRPMHRQRSTLSAKHDPGASRSWNILTSVCYHANALIGIHLGRGGSVTGKVWHMSVRGGLFLTGNLSATRPYSGCNKFFRASPHAPHPAQDSGGDYWQPKRLKWKGEEQVRARWKVLDLKAVTTWKIECKCNTRHTFKRKHRTCDCSTSVSNA